MVQEDELCNATLIYLKSGIVWLLHEITYKYTQGGPEFMVQILKVGTGPCNNHL